MAYRRRFKKRVHTKKRRTFRKRRRGNFASRVRSVMNKDTQIKRRSAMEFMNQGFETPQNMCALVPLASCGSVTEMEALMDQPVLDVHLRHGQATDSVAIQKVGQYVYPTTGRIFDRPTGQELMDDDPNTTTTMDGYRCKFSGYQTKVLLKNSELHPIDVTLYEIVAKKRRTDNSAASGVYAQLMADISTGLDSGEHYDDVSAPATELFAGGDSLYEYVSAGGTIEPYVKSHKMDVQPTWSPVFKQYWRVVKAKKYRLQPGDEVNWKAPSLSYTFNPYRLYNYNTAEKLDIVPGITRVLLAKVSGVLGRSDAVGEESRIGHLKAEIIWKRECKAQLLPYVRNVHGLIRATTITHSDLSVAPGAAAVLEAQSEHVLVAEDTQ